MGRIGQAGLGAKRMSALDANAGEENEKRSPGSTIPAGRKFEEVLAGNELICGVFVVVIKLESQRAAWDKLATLRIRSSQTEGEAPRMGVSHGRSRVTDLAFQVSSRVIHPDWLTTRVFRRVGQGAWEADIRIIEGGHVISFRSGRVRISEVLAGPETLLPEEGILNRSAIKNERSISYRPEGEVEYQSCFEVERVDREVFRHLDQEISLEGSRGDLFFRFGSANRLAPLPISRIYLEPMQRGLAVHTFLTFPDENAIVRTQSSV